MNINPVGNGNYYIEIGDAELRGGSIEGVLRDGAVALPEDAVYEVFGGTDGALVFARARRGSPSYFVFATFDALLMAADGAGNAADCLTYLARHDGRFWLIFYPWAGEAPPSTLGEFGDAAERAHPNLARHLAEHGEVLMGPHALAELRRIFGA